MTDFDIVIIGGGLVGAGLVLALARQHWRVALVESRPPDVAPSLLEDDWDARIYAISPTNQAWLAALDAWPTGERATPVVGMDVWGDAHGAISFDARTAWHSELAWIVENRTLLAAIWRQFHGRNAPTIYAQTQPVAIHTTHQAARVVLDNGVECSARLVIGADGANSWVRQQLGIECQVKAYGQSGVVANFATEKPHHHRARQWFTGESVLAWLPLAGQRMSMVWSHAQPETLLSLSAEALAARVADAGQYALGDLTVLTPAAAFPLRLIQPESMIAPRVLLVGDAAHTVHPLAGQGVNLGFGDARMVAQLCGLARSYDVGAWPVLRRYERRRREAIRTMQQTCDGLHTLFHTDDKVCAWLRNTGLNVTNRLSPLKKLLAAQAIGI